MRTIDPQGPPPNMTMASAATTTNVAAGSQYTGNSGVGPLGSGAASAGGVPSSPAAPSQQQHQFPDIMKARLAVVAAAANSNTVQTQVCDTSNSTRLWVFHTS
jgi:hypothetical protein